MLAWLEEVRLGKRKSKQAYIKIKFLKKGLFKCLCLLKIFSEVSKRRKSGVWRLRRHKNLKQVNQDFPNCCGVLFFGKHLLESELLQSTAQTHKQNLLNKLPFQSCAVWWSIYFKLAGQSFHLCRVHLVMSTGSSATSTIHYFSLRQRCRCP